MEKKRCRSNNWDDAEKQCLIEGVKKHLLIIEDKKKLTSSNRCKEEAWKDIQARLQIEGYNRDILRMKEQWQRMKLQAKRSIRTFRKLTSLTGGGKPPTEPSELDYIIADMVPHEFVIETNLHDSDNINVDSDNINKGNSMPVQEFVDTNSKEIIYIEHAEDSEDQVQNIVSITEAEVTSQMTPVCSQSVKRRKSEKKPMTEYEDKMLELNAKKIEQTMRHNEEMHQLKLRYEIQYQEERLRTLKK